MGAGQTSGAVELLARTVRNSFRFQQRSSLPELLNYVLCVVFFHLAIGIVLMLGLNHDAFATAQDILQAAYFIPVPALLARRLHDQDRTAGLLWLAAPGTALWIARKAITLAQAPSAREAFDSYTWPLDLAAGLASLALIIALILPGTTGPNRFGPDSRPA